MEMKKLNFMLLIDILRNSSQKNWVSWGVLFKGLGVQKDTQMPCWLILTPAYVLEDGRLGKYLVITPQKSKLKNHHRNFCLSEQEIF